jgi:hypothetical protein
MSNEVRRAVWKLFSDVPVESRPAPTSVFEDLFTQQAKQYTVQKQLEWEFDG